jgi:hypothetical protein
MEKFIDAIVFSCILFNSYGQIKNDTVMTERYDFEITENGSKGALIGCISNCRFVIVGCLSFAPALLRYQRQLLLIQFATVSKVPCQS